MLRKLNIFVLFLIFLLEAVIPATAITEPSELDGEDHPWVVLLVMDIGGEPALRCSGTLLSPTVVLTAGHCTSNYPSEPYTGMRVFTESDVDNGNNTYPFAGGPNSVEAVLWAAHPLYEDDPFWYHDVGVVILEEPIYLDEYGVLPEVDQLDVLKTRRGLQDTTFTAVGYGLQRINPVFIQADRVRMVAYPHLIQINVPGYTGDFSLLLSNNHSTGGTCFGDSGGPNFLGDSNVVAGVTSFGKNGNCAGTGGVFRMDRQDVIDFVNEALAGNTPVGTITADINRGGNPPGSDRGVESAAGNLVADAQLWATSSNSADIAFMNPGGVRSDLLYAQSGSEGDGVVTYGEAFTFQPFGNTLVTYEMTGAEIVSVLEEQCQPAGSSRPFLHLGVTDGVTYDLAKTIVANVCTSVTISNVMLNGVPLDPTSTYNITVNSFLADGGDNFDTFATITAPRLDGGNDLQGLVNYLETFSPVSPPITDRVNELP